MLHIPTHASYELNRFHESPSYFSPTSASTTKSSATSKATRSRKLSIATIVAIVVGGLILVGIVVGVVLWAKRKTRDRGQRIPKRSRAIHPPQPPQAPQPTPFTANQDQERGSDMVERRGIEVMGDGTQLVTLSFGRRQDNVTNRSTELDGMSSLNASGIVTDIASDLHTSSQHLVLGSEDSHQVLLPSTFVTDESSPDLRRQEASSSSLPDPIPDSPTFEEPPPQYEEIPASVLSGTST